MQQLLNVQESAVLFKRQIHLILKTPDLSQEVYLFIYFAVAHKFASQLPIFLPLNLNYDLSGRQVDV